MTTSTNTSGLPITQLGSTIKSHLGIAGKYEGKAEEHYKSAGLHLVEAKARIAAGEYQGKFAMFLMRECNDLSSSRAYELIAIAQGTKTVEGVRAETAARKRAERLRKGAVRDVTESVAPSKPVAPRQQAKQPAPVTVPSSPTPMGLSPEDAYLLRSTKQLNKLDWEQEARREELHDMGDALNKWHQENPTGSVEAFKNAEYSHIAIHPRRLGYLMFYAEHYKRLEELRYDLQFPATACVTLAQVMQEIAAMQAPDASSTEGRARALVDEITDALRSLGEDQLTAFLRMLKDAPAAPKTTARTALRTTGHARRPRQRA